MNDELIDELMSQSVLDDVAASARKHKVMISITITPYDENDTPDE